MLDTFAHLAAKQENKNQYKQTRQDSTRVKKKRIVSGTDLWNPRDLGCYPCPVGQDLTTIHHPATAPYYPGAVNHLYEFFFFHADKVYRHTTEVGNSYFLMLALRSK